MKKKVLNTLCLGLAATTAVASVASLTSCGETYEDNVYNTTYAGTFSEGAWDPLTWQTNLDSTPLGYTTSGLYAFNFNDSYDGYVIDPEMASAMPEDVTATYAGQYNVPADAKAGTGYAYKVTLREGMSFDNGTAINAQTFIDSYKLLIDAAYDNYRADTWESSGFCISNSTLYHFQGQTTLTSINDVATYDSLASNNTDEDANCEHKYYAAIYNSFNYKTPAAMMADITTLTAADFYEDAYVYLGDTYATAYAKYCDLCKACDNVQTEETYTGKFGDEAFVNYTYPERDDDWFDANVGFKAVSDYELLFVFDQPVNTFNFKTNTSSTFVVDTKYYKSCTTTAADGSKSSTYNKTAETSVSYGPYKMSTYTTTGFSLVKNDSWYGYTSTHSSAKEYQTNKINYSLVEQDSTILMGFKKGDYDDANLTADTVSEYATSEQVLDVPESYLMSLFNNTDLTKLAKLDTDGTTINAKLYSIDDFRKGFSYALNREDAVLAAPGSSASALLLNTLYMSDAENGKVYRNSTSAKEVYSLLYGDGATVKSSYSVQKAAEYFDAAYTYAVENDLIDTSSKTVKFNIGMTNLTGDEYQGLISNVKKYINAAFAASTNFKDWTFELIGEGTASARYSKLLAGETVMAFCAWGGNTFDPYGFLQVYLDPNYNYMPGFDPLTETVTVTVNGTDVKKTYYQWYKAISSGEYSEALGCSYDTRVYILSRLEAAYIQELEIIPMYALGSKSLYSFKVSYPTTEYVTGMGFGGVQYMTYNYTGAEWAKQVKAGLKY